MVIQLGLQSGFAVALLIAAVLVAHRMGGWTLLVQRGAQVALGITLMLLVQSATTAFYVHLGLVSESQLRGREAEAGIIHLGIGIILVAASMAIARSVRIGVTRNWRTLTPSLLLGGLLLILMGTSTNTSSFYLSLGYPPGETTMGPDVARFVVLAVGTLLLARLLYRWDRRHIDIHQEDTQPQAMGPSPDS